jgi:glycosyltransferase involved in cell wall biosynthesis
MSYTRRTALGKIVIVHTTDTGGGVARRLMVLLDAFQARGVDTWLVAGAKHSEHPRVVWMHKSPHVDYRPYQPWRRRELTRMRWRLDRAMGREDFEHPFTRHVLEMTGGAPPDLVLCENLHGGYFDLRMLPWLSHRVPLVLSLNDSWLFTGHCACPLTCGRWEEGCGHCPDLDIPPAVHRDSTAGNWRRKRDLLAVSRVWALAPSRWMLERSRRSLLRPALEDVRVVEHGIDLETFSPGFRLGARQKLGIDSDSVVMLYVANLGAANPTKDFPTLRRALLRFAQEAPLLSSDGRPIRMQVLVVGCNGPEERLCEYVSIRHLPRCDSQADLAELYRASDLPRSCSKRLIGR